MTSKNTLWTDDPLKIKLDSFDDKKISVNNGVDKKYNVKFANEDLELLNELQSFYGIKNKSDLIQLILCNYLKQSLHAEGVARDVALSIALITDAYCNKDDVNSDVSSWQAEVVSHTDYKDNLLNYGPAAKKIKLSKHNGVEHSESFLQVGIKLLQFCEKENLITTKEYKKLFKSLEQWNTLTKNEQEA